MKQASPREPPAKFSEIGAYNISCHVLGRDVIKVNIFMTFDTSLVSKNTSHYGDFTFLLGAYNYKPLSSKGKSILRGPKEVFFKVECIY